MRARDLTVLTSYSASGCVTAARVAGFATAAYLGASSEYLTLAELLGSLGLWASSGRCHSRLRTCCFQPASFHELCRCVLPPSRRKVPGRCAGSPKSYGVVKRTCRLSPHVCPLEVSNLIHHLGRSKRLGCPGSLFRLGSRATSPRSVASSSGNSSAPTGAFRAGCSGTEP